MKLQVPRNSLFAILPRSPWWLSVLLALGVFAVARLAFPAGVAALAALPFVLIALYAAFQQWRRPGARRVAATLERARGLPWGGFCSALEEAFRHEGYEVTRMHGGADLELTREGRVTLVACKRWKAVRTGIEPLREFDAATGGHGAHSRIYVSAGEVTDTARAFAAQRQIRVLQGEELAKLLARTKATPAPDPAGRMGAYSSERRGIRPAIQAGEGTRMDWDRIEGNWQHFKGNAKRHWVKLSVEELDAVAGRRDQLAGKIQEVYGVSKEIAEKQLSAWQHAQKENSPFR